MQALDSDLRVSFKVPVGPFQKGAVTLGFTRGGKPVTFAQIYNWVGGTAGNQVFAIPVVGAGLGAGVEIEPLGTLSRLMGCTQIVGREIFLDWSIYGRVRQLARDLLVFAGFLKPKIVLQIIPGHFAGRPAKDCETRKSFASSRRVKLNASMVFLSRTWAFTEKDSLFAAMKDMETS
jgi:hypothetical protein